MNIKQYPDRDMLAIDLANSLAGELEQALFNHDQVSFAVPGGTTPGPIFDALCAADLDWSRIHVMATDERIVDPSNDRSNAKLIRERLLVNRAAAAQMVAFEAPVEDPDSALPQLAEQVAPLLPVSVLLLGMGADMHTASLFPAAPGLAKALSGESPLAILRPDTMPEARLSLSAPVLDGALSKHLVIFGADKRAALDRAMSLPPEEAPVQAVLSEITVHWAE